MITQKIQKFNEHKKLNLLSGLSHLYSFNLKKADRCLRCGNFLEFKKLENLNTLELKFLLQYANFCKVRFCPMCAWRKVLKVAKEVKSIISQIEAHHKNISYLFLTLTVKNPPLNELKDTLKLMSEAYRRMWDKELKKRYILGYIRSLEIMGDHTKKGEAHPHYHVLLAVNGSYFSHKYISKAHWVELWKKYLKADYEPIVDIRKIKSKNKDFLDSDSAVLECVKYSVAPMALNKMSKKDFKLLDSQVKGARQYNMGGVFKDFKALDEVELDPALWKELEELFYCWNKDKLSYEKEN